VAQSGPEYTAGSSCWIIVDNRICILYYENLTSGVN
jgi:hypothetical protein